MKKHVLIPILFVASFVGYSQNDTIIKKDGNKEVKVIISNNGNNKEVAVFKKYIVTDDEDLEEVMDKLNKDKANTKEKKEIIIIREGDQKIVREFKVNSLNLDSLEKVVELELGKLEDEIVIDSPNLKEKEDAITIQDGDTTKVMIGKRMLVITHDEKGDTKVKFDKNEENEVAKEESDKDTNDEEPSVRKSVDTDWFGLDLGLNILRSNDPLATANAKKMSELNQWKSVNVTTYFVPTRVSLNKKGSVSLKSAIALDFNNYRYSHDMLLNPDTDVVTFDEGVEKLKKNKLVTTYAQIPLLLNFKVGKKKHKVDFSVGGYAGYLIDAKTKRVNQDGDKIKKHDDFLLNPIKYGLTARLDFRWFDFYVNYNLSEVFKDNKIPSYQVVSAGVNLIHF